MNFDKRFSWNRAQGLRAAMAADFSDFRRKSGKPFHFGGQCFVDWFF